MFFFKASPRSNFRQAEETDHSSAVAFFSSPAGGEMGNRFSGYSGTRISMLLSAVSARTTTEGTIAPAASLEKAW